MTTEIKQPGHRHRLRYRVTDVPPWQATILLAFQQAMTCVSSLLIVPYLVSETACAGQATAQLRVQLISTAFVVTGLSTILQTTFGMRLPLLQGMSYAFIPVVVAFKGSKEFECPYTESDEVEEGFWKNRMQLLQGSLVAASFLIVILGATGLVGRLTRFIGPITTTALLFSLVLSAVPVALEQMELHWISIIQFAVLVICTVFMTDVKVPILIYRGGFRWKYVKIFGFFPYLIAIGIVWSICAILTVTKLEPEDGQARIDRNRTMEVLRTSPWLNVPYPMQFGMLKFNVGLFLGFIASSIAVTTECLGEYYMASRACHEESAETATINRAVIFEGIGCMLAGLFGIGTGVTTYIEPIALISVTKVASRITMQLAGVLMIVLGIFTKFAAVLGTIPEPLVGAMLAMGMSMIGGVALSNIQLIDAKSARNMTIMGLAIVTGILVPGRFKHKPVHTDNVDINQVLDLILTNQMLIAALTAFVLDSIAPGVTAQQRGLGFHDQDGMTFEKGPIDGVDGYSFSPVVERFIMRTPLLQRAPFMPKIPMNNVKSVQLEEKGAGLA